MADSSQKTPVNRVQTEALLTPQRIVLALALGLAFVAYSRTLKFPFVWDDHAQILENPIIQSWRFLPRYFTQHVWESIEPISVGTYYRPLFLLWLRVNNMVFGLRPWGWHLTNVLAHLAVTLLVYFLAARLAKDRVTGAVAAMIFGVHPTHIEAVAWISGVTDPLCALLFIGSVLSYLKQEEAGRRGGTWRVTSLLLFAAAMLVKETAVVLPGIILFVHEGAAGASLDDVGAAPCGSPEGRHERLSLVRRVQGSLGVTAPYLFLVAVYLAARALALKELAHTMTPLPFSTMVFTWPSLLWFYLKLLVWPATISPAYRTPYISAAGFTTFFVPSAGVLAAGVLLGAFLRMLARREVTRHATQPSRAVLIASAWVFLPLLPLLDLRALPKGDVVHARYLYLPSVGFSLLVALALRSIPLDRWVRLARWAFPAPLAALLVIPYTLITISQSPYWADDWVYCNRAIATAPDNVYIKTNLASYLGERGQYGPAINLYQQVLAEDTTNWLANYNLGYTYYRIGKLDLAEYYLKRAISIQPVKPDQYLYLGLTELRAGRPEEAASTIRVALRLKPTAPRYHFALGMVLKVQRDTRGAIREFKEELALNPNEQAAREQLQKIESAGRKP